MHVFDAISSLFNGLASTAGITWAVKKKPLCATPKAGYPLSGVVKRI
jgi:hypothetical protein